MDIHLSHGCTAVVPNTMHRKRKGNQDDFRYRQLGRRHIQRSFISIGYQCSIRSLQVKHDNLIPLGIHLRYLKLECLENPTYVELIPHSQASLPICYCISTLLVSNTVMTKTRLCRSDNSLPTEKRTLVSPFLCQTSKSKIGL